MKHDCPNCQCDKQPPVYPAECPKCGVLYGPGFIPANHGMSTCDGVPGKIPGAKYVKIGRGEGPAAGATKDRSEKTGDLAPLSNFMVETL